MPASYIRVESEGSYWLLDEINMRYLRMPKSEGPRPPGWWKRPVPGDALNDLEWHTMEDWYISDQPIFVKSETGQTYVHYGVPLLVIRTSGSHRVFAPKAQVK